MSKAFNQIWVPACTLIGANCHAWDRGDRTVTDETVLQFQTLWYAEFIPLFVQVGLSSVYKLHSVVFGFISHAFVESEPCH